jgi:hypothetical protein
MSVRRDVFLALVILVFLAGPVSAHSPAAMQLTYDQAAGELVVTISHDVADPATHYVRDVEILNGGGVILNESYSSQPAADTFTYRYDLSAAPGDEISVTARCNIGGLISRQVTLPGSGTVLPDQNLPASPAPKPLWPTHAALLITGIICIVTAGLLPVYGKTISGWYRFHVGLAVTGSILSIVGIVLVFRVPYLSGDPTAFFIHVILGLLLLVTLLAALILALTRNRAGSRKILFRSSHIWAGRLFILLVLVNIILGLKAVGFF